MKFLLVSVCVLLSKAVGLSTRSSRLVTTTTTTSRRRPSSALFVSTGNIGLGPGKDSQQKSPSWVEGVDYEVPDHEAYRTSRRSKLDEQCDVWFGTLLQAKNGILGDELCQTMRDILTTPVPLYNELRLARDDEEWTPYVSTKLPWTPLTPAFGLEQYGLPIPRRNAETWRHFDVVGMINTDYSSVPKDIGKYNHNVSYSCILMYCTVYLLLYYLSLPLFQLSYYIYIIYTQDKYWNFLPTR
jgi:hypothetical protein